MYKCSKSNKKLKIKKIDGIALQAAIIKYWHQLENQCPKIITTTHFNDIFNLKFFPKSNLLSCYVRIFFVKINILDFRHNL